MERLQEFFLVQHLSEQSESVLKEQTTAKTRSLQNTKMITEKQFSTKNVFWKPH